MVSPWSLCNIGKKNYSTDSGDIVAGTFQGSFLLLLRVFMDISWTSTNLSILGLCLVQLSGFAKDLWKILNCGTQNEIVARKAAKESFCLGVNKNGTSQKEICSRKGPGWNRRRPRHRQSCRPCKCKTQCACSQQWTVASQVAFQALSRKLLKDLCQVFPDDW